MRVRDLPVPLIGLVMALQLDQRDNPHRSPDYYPLRNVMLAAQRLDESGRTRSEYEALSVFIEKWARKHMRPDAICGECGTLMCKDVPVADYDGLSYRQVFAFNRTDGNYFLCDWCSETWLCEGDQGLPRVTGLKHYYKHEERWANDGKDKLPPLPPSGPLFAGLVIPGGSGPATVPFRADARVLLCVSRVLDRFPLALTEKTA
jgi:hypothetical protein